jgi:hypothetical protein
MTGAKLPPMRWESARVFANGERPTVLRYIASGGTRTPDGDLWYWCCEPTLSGGYQLWHLWARPRPGECPTESVGDWVDTFATLDAAKRCVRKLRKGGTHARTGGARTRRAVRAVRRRRGPMNRAAWLRFLND